MDYLANSIEDARILNAQFEHTNETNIFQSSTFDRYNQRGNFDVIHVDLNEWIISMPSPFFLPDSPIIEFLERGFFASAKVDDECNLIVMVLRPVNNIQDEDYIRESFDYALEWLPRWKVAEAAFIKYKEQEEQMYIAQKAWHQAQKTLYA